MKKLFYLFSLMFLTLSTIGTNRALSQGKTSLTPLWQIGKGDNSDAEFALAPSGYAHFLEKDFGWEDGFYLIGSSTPEKNWPYALPGPEDNWGGTSNTAGWRSSVLNILFGIDKLPRQGQWELVIDLLDVSAAKPPLLKVTINDSSWEYHLPAGSGDSTLKGSAAKVAGDVVKIPVPAGVLKKGGNEVTLKSLWGSWLVFDQVRMDGPSGARIATPNQAFIRDVSAADYDITDQGKAAQPLLIDVQHVSGEPLLEVFVDGKEIFQQKIDTGRYIFEAPMPAVTTAKESTYEIKLNGRPVRSGSVRRSPQRQITPAGYVDTKMGTAHSRWMIAPGPWMPFSMVKISPDNQNAGWQARYDPIFESIGGFSHIHEWTMSGLSMLPVNGPLVTRVGDQTNPKTGYRSSITKNSERAPLGYYKVHLKKYNITAELTATTRCSFQRYTYPKEKTSRVLVDFSGPAEYGYKLPDVEVTKVSDHRIEGFSKQKAPAVWGKDIDQDYTVHFVMEFDRPITGFGYWIDSSVRRDVSALKVKDAKHAGVFLEFNTTQNPVVQVRTGISYVSIQGAEENLHKEIVQPFGWDFSAVRKHNMATWNELFNRVKITTLDAREKMRFYTNMYRALCSRNTYNDVDGKWVDATGDIRQLKDTDARALGCDAFWNAFWNLNQFWNLVTPEWSSRWVRSELAMYDANGALAKGPAGMKYIPVMVAEHEIPLIVGAYQMGIRNYNVEKAYAAVRKMETTPAWKIGDGLAGNHDLKAFLKYKYVPYDKGRFSNTLEYAYDNWTVAQFARALGKTADDHLFADRGSWWKNAVDKKTGYARLRNSDGSWMKDFDPFRSGANSDYVEGNAWQLTYFVPQDMPGLIKWIGADRFVDRLKWGFKQSYPWRFNAPGDQYWEFPVVQGNQQSMQFAFLFNWAHKPWLTQKWSRAILDRYYGYGLSNAYLGDEDQGQMSAWFLMAAMGLFQTDGGCSVNPVYEIASPIFKKITIDLGNRFGRGGTFTIIAHHVSRKNMYIQSAVLNGKKLESCMFPASELLKGGQLILEMGAHA
ncbi:MAG TPA: GH92 family glycosyl hydrolase [Chitinophagaceae bacterium]|nr:GH92 family glycosyl hydrolase [Chitinophagaceae bacterium]